MISKVKMQKKKIQRDCFMFHVSCFMFHFHVSCFICPNILHADADADADTGVIAIALLH